MLDFFVKRRIERLYLYGEVFAQPIRLKPLHDVLMHVNGKRNNDKLWEQHCFNCAQNLLLLENYGIQKDLEIDSNVFDRDLFKKANSLRFMHYLSLKEAVTLESGGQGSFKLTSFKDYLDSFDEEMRRKLKFFIPEASFHIDVNFSEGNEKESIFSERILSPNSRGLSLCIFMH
jgi:hypothetical protein